MTLSGGPKTKAIEFLIRTVTASLLALGIVGGVLYQAITTGDVTAALLGWGGIVVGSYITQHAMQNGQTSGEVRLARDVLTSAAESAVTGASAAPDESTTPQRRGK